MEQFVFRTCLGSPSRAIIHQILELMIKPEFWPSHSMWTLGHFQQSMINIKTPHALLVYKLSTNGQSEQFTGTFYYVPICTESRQATTGVILVDNEYSRTKCENVRLRLFCTNHAGRSQLSTVRTISARKRISPHKSLKKYRVKRSLGALPLDNLQPNNITLWCEVYFQTFKEFWTNEENWPHFKYNNQLWDISIADFSMKYRFFIPS